jgi:hypothetical protein
MPDIYLVTMSPKRDYRSLRHYVLLVSANNQKHAISMIPAAWPIGDSSFLQPRAVKIGNEFTTSL